MWVWSALASLTIALTYFAVSYFIARGLIASHQLRSNALGLGTAMIFFSCGFGHLLHAEHALLDDGTRFRGAVDLHMTVWDASTAAIAVWYLSMRRRYGQLLHSPSLFEDHTRVAAESEARHAATHDHLTDLPNRQALFEALEHALDPRHGPGTRALLFIDLDGFKEVNDRHGHLTGDAVLIAASERLRRARRASDVLARLGGDEFVVLLQGASTAEEAIAVAMRHADALSAPFEIGGATISITTSIGIALAEPGEASAAELLHRADIAMYDAKNDGPGRHRLHARQSA
jgi:diguanylate cyclase (GGDEF)-like protein